MQERRSKIMSRFSLCVGVIISIACSLEPSVLRSPTESRLRRIGDVPARRGWYKLQFINEQEAWLSTGNELWHSFDGGKRWNQCCVGIRSWGARDIDRFEFVDSQTGWVLASSLIYSTRDGGRSWVTLTLPDSDAVIHSIEFLDDGEHGWAAGEGYRLISQKDAARVPSQLLSSDGRRALYPAVFYTEDGGSTWYPQRLPSSEGRLLHLYCIDVSHCWASSDAEIFYLEGSDHIWRRVNYSKRQCTNKLLLETTQGTAKSGIVYQPVAIYFLNATQGWLSFRNGYMAQSADGGRSWCDGLDPRSVWASESWGTFFQKVYFTHSVHGWGLSAEGALYETNDGGKYWAEVNVEARLEDIYFLGNSGWAVAEGGLYSIGR